MDTHNEKEIIAHEFTTTWSKDTGYDSNFYRKYFHEDARCEFVLLNGSMIKNGIEETTKGFSFFFDLTPDARTIPREINSVGNLVYVESDYVATLADGTKAKTGIICLYKFRGDKFSEFRVYANTSAFIEVAKAALEATKSKDI